VKKLNKMRSQCGEKENVQKCLTECLKDKITANLNIAGTIISKSMLWKEFSMFLENVGIKLTQNGCQRLAILIVAMDTQLLYKVRTFSLCCTTYLTIRCEIVPLWFQCSVTIGHNKVHAWISRQHVDVINAENVTVNFKYSYMSVYGLSV
jgi:hypothetical protein